jgi:glutamine synthetase
VYEESDVAVDHNQLVMATLRKVAIRHGLQAIMHEKPFAGINGSGKHCNWALAIACERPELNGVNLLKPGKTPHQNVRFLVFLAAVLKGVHKHAGLLRAGIASSGNEHRLGANEAPPAIISVFMGRALTRLIEDIAEGRTSEASAAQAMLRLGVAKLPEVEQDNTDRNRTSPFAFTGAKFEFRAVGGSASAAFPVTMINAAVAEAIGEITAQIREAMTDGRTADDVVLEVVRRAFQESAAVRFEGNNYSQAWVEEAERRGLLNLRHSPDALAQLVTPQSRATLTSLGILTDRELDARFHVRLERYAKDLQIELHALLQIVDTTVLPACYSYLNQLAAGAAQARAAGITRVPQAAAAEHVGALVETLQERREALAATLAAVDGLEDAEAQARRLTTEGAERLRETREACDALEVVVADELWPLPKYREMLFPV